MQKHTNMQIMSQSLFQSPKIVKKSMSLKNNIIVFPNQNYTEPNLSSSPNIKKRILSPSKQAIQCLKMKKERQKYIQNQQQINLQNQNLIYSKFIYNPESPSKLSVLRKCPQTVDSKRRYSQNEQSPNNRLMKSARLKSSQNGRQNIKSQRYNRQELDSRQIKNKIKEAKNLMKNLKSMEITNGTNDLFQCQKVKKQCFNQFFNEKISSMLKNKNDISKKNNNLVNSSLYRNNSPTQAQNQEKSFNVILKRLKQTNATQANQIQRLRKNKKNIILLQSPVSKKQNKQKIKHQLFEMALQWSKKRIQLTNSPQIKKISSNYIHSKNDKIDRKIKQRKRQDQQIEGWIK